MNPKNWEKLKIIKIIKQTSTGFHSWVKAKTPKGEIIKVKKPNNKIPKNI